MRKRDALRLAKAFVKDKYPDYAHRYIEVALEEDCERQKSWSFGVHADEEDADYVEGDTGLVGYVHADGHIEGLY